MKLLATLLTTAALSATAQADLLIVMHGTVADVGPTPPAGFAFAGAQLGDPVRLAFTLETPGVTSNPESRFEFTDDALELQVGAEAVQSSFVSSFPLTVLNDQVTPGSPLVDSVTGHLAIPALGGLDIRVQDFQGQMLSTSDLSLTPGTFLTPDFSYLWLVDATLQGNIFVDLDSMDVVELGAVGSSYCTPAVPNSTGAPALLAGFGSNIASANRLEMQASQLPQNEVTLLLVGDQQSVIQSPGGSQGNLCLAGGQIGRFQDQIISSGAQGMVTVEVDLTALPVPSGTVAVMAGQTWNFQLWYRDQNPSATSNFSNPIEVTFQ